MNEDLNVRCAATRETRERPYDERTPLESILRSQDFAPSVPGSEAAPRLVVVETNKEYACAEA